MPTIFTSMKRIFDRPEPTVLCGQPRSRGGCHRMTESGKLITEARRLKSRSDPARAPGRLRFFLQALALLTSLILGGFLLIWLSTLGTDDKASSWAFSGLSWAFAGFCLLVVSILFLNPPPTND